ncbi:uncharacterized protein VTP21DRAFT_3078 [Calcarisporiella thermophila]|uniref:uncharacterized protein n=1 Tax=Calcarisporiella thermophila TaxID=911321 RepID=UPI003741FAD7
MAILRHLRNNVPREVIPLLFVVGCGVTGGLFASLHKLTTDPHIRRHNSRHGHH